ncbi:MAG: hypothetical protein HFH36_04225 [Lachnospiraceae bacterium]|nr:hypothetical protein [Lachnospiraceae bacterium]
MKRRIVALLLASVLALSISACGDSADTPSTPSSAESDTEQGPADTPSPEENDAEPAADSTYQDILEEYTQKMKDAAPGLADEFKAEAEEKAGDTASLAELSTSKTEKLAAISTEGLEKMAELKIKNGDDDETYQEWAEKLNTAYMEQAQIISDAYMDSATGGVPSDAGAQPEGAADSE